MAAFPLYNERDYRPGWRHELQRKFFRAIVFQKLKNCKYSISQDKENNDILLEFNWEEGEKIKNE